MGKLGTVFVELGLDDKVYKQKLGETLTSTTATAKGIETSWKVLGTRSDVIFDQQRKSYENAMTLIKSSTNSTANDIIRAEQAKASKIAQINEQQYGKQLSTIDKLKSNWIAASVAITAAWMTINKAVQYMDQGAQALQVESSFKIMAEASGASADDMIDNMKRATKSTIEESDMMQKAVKLMTLGYNPEQIERFSKVVITASQIAGTTASEAYERLADSIANKMPKALVQMGAVTREQMKIVTAAIAAGADSMALYELAMANLELKQKMLQGTQDSATIALQQFHASMKEITETAGKALIRFTAMAIEGFYGIAVGAAYASYGIAKVVEWSSKLGAWTADKAGLDALSANLKAIGNKNAADAESLKSFAESTTAKIKGLEGETTATEKATKTEIDGAKAKVDAQVAALQKIVDAKKNAGKIDKAEEDWAKKMIGLQGDINKVYQDDLGRALTDIETKYKEYMVVVDAASKKLGITLKTDVLENWKQTVIEQAKLADELKNTKSLLDAINTASEYQRKLTIDTKNAAIERTIAEANSAATTQKSYIDIYSGNGQMSIADSLKAKYEIDKKSLDLEQLKVEALGREAYTEAEIATAYKADFDLQLKRKSLEADYGVELEKNRKEIILQSSSVTGGLKVAYEDLYKSRLTWSQAAYNFEIDTYKGMATGFEDFFYDVLTGDMKSMSDYWDSMWKSMAKSMSQQLGQMMSQWVLYGNTQKAATSGTSILGGDGTSSSDSGWSGLVGLAGKAGSSIWDWLSGGSSAGDTQASDSTWTDAISSAGGEDTNWLDWTSMHTGGVVPRLHSGLAADEFPAILQAGETVIPKGGVDAASQITVQSAEKFRQLILDAGSDVMYSMSNGTSAFVNGVATAQSDFSKGVANSTSTFDSEVSKTADNWGGRILGFVGGILGGALGASTGIPGASQAGSMAGKYGGTKAGNALWNWGASLFGGGSSIEDTNASANTWASAIAAEAEEAANYVGNLSTAAADLTTSFNDMNVSVGGLDDTLAGMSSGGPIGGWAGGWGSGGPNASYANEFAPGGEFGMGLAEGMDYVPFDNFKARLHKGETVLPRKEAEQYRGDKGGGVKHFHLNLDGKEIGSWIVNDDDTISGIRDRTNKFTRAGR